MSLGLLLVGIKMRESRNARADRQRWLDIYLTPCAWTAAWDQREVQTACGEM